VSVTERRAEISSRFGRGIERRHPVTRGTVDAHAKGTYQELEEVVTAEKGGWERRERGGDVVRVEKKDVSAGNPPNVGTTREFLHTTHGRVASGEAQTRSGRRPGGITHYSGFIVAASRPCGGATTNASTSRFSLFCRALARLHRGRGKAHRAPHVNRKKRASWMEVMLNC
jgi:hypothetical protein